MAKDPAFLFYSSDFLAGIQDLTMDERGQYITLLCLQHQKGHLSDKIIKLAVANAAADVLAKFRQDEEGLWFNDRLDIEIGKRKSHTDKQRERAVEGWKKRKLENAASDTTADAAALPLENENENEDINIKKKKGVQGKKEFTKPSLEEFKQYFKENGYREDVAERAWKGYDVAAWHNTLGKPVKNWKQTAINVWFKDENKAASQKVFKFNA